ncbi:hypothetical protein K440DRAFT_626800 [Wilcoxina mikolae CBS 423.85]|nr:hypothetical protein K440DRAFT_626800 [Wilcoxina mikolae CBS 423.85]
MAKPWNPPCLVSHLILFLLLHFCPHPIISPLASAIVHSFNFLPVPRLDPPHHPPPHPSFLYGTNPIHSLSATDSGPHLSLLPPGR